MKRSWLKRNNTPRTRKVKTERQKKGETMSLRKILEELANCYYECGKLGIRIPAKLDLAHQQILALIPKKTRIGELQPKPCPYSEKIKCCTMQDYARNEAISEITHNLTKEE